MTTEEVRIWKRVISFGVVLPTEEADSFISAVHKEFESAKMSAGGDSDVWGGYLVYIDIPPSKKRQFNAFLRRFCSEHHIALSKKRKP